MSKVANDVPGVGRLVPEGAVELGGVPHRLVDGEPQVRRVDDEVVGPGLHRRGRHLLGQERRQRLELGGEVPAVARGVLPAAPHRRGDGPHRLEGPRLGVHGDGFDHRVDADASLGGHRARQVGVVLVLDHGEHPGGDVVDDLGCHEPPAPVLEEGHLVGQRHRGGVHLVGRGPLHLAVGGLLGHLHPGPEGGRGLGGQAGGVLRQPGGGLGGELDGGREPDGPVPHHVQPDPDLGVVHGGLHPAVAQRHELRTDPLHPHLGVAAPERLGPLQGRVAHLSERQPRQPVAVPGPHARTLRQELGLSRPRRPGPASGPR